MKKVTYTPINHSASRKLNFTVEGFSVELHRNIAEFVTEEQLEKLKTSSQFDSYLKDNIIRVEDSPEPTEEKPPTEKKSTSRVTKIE